eukprot:14810994-Alexandrium_andersonii.AAC.1
MLPDDVRRALGDKLEPRTFSERLQFAKCRLGLEKHRALAQEAAVGASVSVEVGALMPEDSGGGQDLSPLQVEE